LNLPEKILSLKNEIPGLTDFQFKPQLHGASIEKNFDFQEIQMRFLTYLTNTFMKLRDRLFISGYSNTPPTTLFQLSEIKDEVGKN